MEDWNEKTGDQMNTTDMTASLAGLRTCPTAVTGEAKAEWKALEPAWRLLHAVTLQEIYRARCRTHAAYHAEPRADPKATSTKHVIRRIKARLQERIGYEHEKAKHARRHSHEEGPMAARSRDTGLLQERQYSPSRGQSWPCSARRQTRSRRYATAYTYGRQQWWNPRPDGGKSQRRGWCQQATSAPTEARSPGYRP